MAQYLQGRLWSGTQGVPDQSVVLFRGQSKPVGMLGAVHTETRQFECELKLSLETGFNLFCKNQILCYFFQCSDYKRAILFQSGSDFGWQSKQ